MPLTRKPIGPAKAQESARPDVLTALIDGGDDERWAAARAASDVPGATDALATALESEADPRVREAMFSSLGRIGSPASIDAIVRCIRSDNASLRTGALDKLRTLRAAARDYLPSLMSDADSDVRLLSCELARDLPSEDAVQLLCELLVRELEPNVCAAAIDVLAEVGSSDALAALAQCEARFQDQPFLVFAIKVARERIQAQSPHLHV